MTHAQAQTFPQRTVQMVVPYTSGTGADLIARGLGPRLAERWKVGVITDNRPGSAVPAGDKRRNTQLFQYDDLYRLTRVGYVFAVPPSPRPIGWGEGQGEGQMNLSWSN